MGNPYDISDDDPEYQALLKRYGVGQQEPQQETGFVDRVKDVGISALKSAISVPETVVGLADIPTFGAVGKGLEKVGFRPKEAKETLDSWYSPAQQEANRKVAEADGFWNTVGTALENPSTIAHSAIESAAPMLTGGLAARGLNAAKLVASPAVAAGIGEGVVGGGLAAEQIRQGSESGYLSPGQVGAAIASGVGTGTLGVMGGRVASRLGIDDVDTGIARGTLREAGEQSQRGLAKRVGAGMLSEGVLEELPQSMQEQVWQNVAQGKPWDEGVGEAGAMGMITGGLMGGGFNALPGRQVAKPSVNDTNIPTNLLNLKPGEQGDLFGEGGSLPAQMTPGYNDAAAEGSPLEARIQDMQADRAQLNTFVQEYYTEKPELAAQAIEMIKRIDAGLRHLTQGAPITDTYRNFNPNQMQLELGNQPRNLLNPEPIQADLFAEENANAPTQVAEAGSSGVGSVGVGSAGNSQAQPGVELGGRDLAGTPVERSGTDRPVGDTGRGNGASVNGLPATQQVAQEAQATNAAQAGTQPAAAQARPGTKQALEASIASIFPEGSTEHADHVNAIQTAKSYAAARKALAKMSPQGLELALRTAPKEEQQIVQAALGWDNEGNQTGTTVKTYSEIGKLVGKTRQRVQQVLKQYGINEQVLTQMAAANQESVSVAELMPSQQEDGGAQEGTGYRLMDSPSEADDIVDDRRTRIETHLANKAAEELGVSAAELSQPSNYQTAAEVRAEEIAAANREAHAAKEREEGAREMAKLAESEKPNWVDHRGLEIQQIDISDSSEDYDAVAKRLGAKAFADLPEAEQLRVVRGYIAYMDDAINAARFKELMKGVANENRAEAATDEREAEEAQVVPRIADGRGEAESSQGAEQAGAAEEVTAEGVIDRWNKGAKALGVVTWGGLNKEQQNFILGSGTWAEFDEAAAEVLDEINGGQGTAFSESDTTQGVDPAKLGSQLKKLFFSPEKFNKLVSIFPDAASIPLDVKEAAAADAHMSVKDVPWEHVQGFAMNGKVYLVAGNIKEGNELAVFLHELGVHVGMERLIGKANMQRLSSQVETWAKSSGTSPEVQFAKDAVRRAEGSASEDYQQEVIAYFVEEAVKHGVNPIAVQKTNSNLAQWFRQLWAAAKVALRKIGLGRFDQLSAQNVVDLAYGAAKMELTGTWHGTAADFRNFNHSYMGSGEGAQAFGWGTYLAQRVGIAKGYWKADIGRKQNRAIEFNGKLYDFQSGDYNDDLMKEFHDDLLTAFPDADMQALETVEVGLLEGVSKQKLIADSYTYEKEYAHIGEDTRRILAKVITGGTEGSLMRVDTAVHDDEMLDWDKPLSEQNEVRIALMPLRKFLSHTADELTGGANWNDMTGEEMYRLVQRALQQDYFDPNLPAVDEALRQGKTDQAASEYLDSIGIKGIKFLDSQSRGLDGVPKVRSKQRSDGTFTHYVDYRDTQGHAATKAFTEKAAAIEFAKQLEQNLTRNLVIFNDKNIQRVSTQVGADRERVKFSQADKGYRDTDKMVKTLFSRFGEYVSHKFQTVENELMFGHNLAKKAQRLIPGTADYFRSIQNKQTTRTRHEQQIAEIANRFYELKTQAERDALNKFVYESTMDGKWGFQPTWFEKDVKTTVDAGMKAKFDALSKEAQQIAKDMFKFGSEQQKRFDESVNANITDPKKKVERSQMYGKPYAPLKRFGNYVVTGRSAEFVKEEQANPGSKKLDEMKSDPNHYYVEFADGDMEAIGIREKMAEKNPDMTWVSKPLLVEDNQLNSMNFTMLEKLKNQIKGMDAKAAKTTKSALESLANQLYITQLNQLHANKSQAPRLNVKGAETDMMRAFVSQGRAEASLIASLQTHAETEKSLQQIINAARSGHEQDTKTRIANTVMRRHLAMLNFKPTPVQDALMATNSVYMLLTSPAYYLTNATQPFVVSMPYMAGKFGGGNSWNALRDAYKTTLDLVKLPTLFKNQNLDQSHLAKFNNVGREADALKTLMDENLVDIGMEMELGDITRMSKNPVFKRIQKGIMTLRTGVGNVEVLNRVSTAVAAYRLAYAGALNKGETADEAHTTGTNFAREAIEATHGNYAGYNAPSVMMQGAHGNLPLKLMTQFKKFQFIQAGLLIGTVKQALKGQTPEERAVARATLKWMLGTQFALAGALGGVTGVPMALLGTILAAAFGDDGEDKEAFLRRQLGGGAFAQLILHGAPAAGGVDISKRIGMGAALDPFRMADPQTDWTDYALSLAGPSAGFASRIANGLSYMTKGQYWKGSEMLIPNGVLTNLSKLARYETEGLTNSRGDVVMKPEEISLMTDVAQTLGLETTQLSDRRWKANVTYDRGIHFKERTSDLQRQYVEAVKDRDQGEMNSIRQEWMELQAERVKQGFKREKMSTLTKAPANQHKRERETINGLQTTDTNRRFVQELDRL